MRYSQQRNDPSKETDMALTKVSWGHQLPVMLGSPSWCFRQHMLASEGEGTAKFHISIVTLFLLHSFWGVIFMTEKKPNIKMYFCACATPTPQTVSSRLEGWIKCGWSHRLIPSHLSEQCPHAQFRSRHQIQEKAAAWHWDALVHILALWKGWQRQSLKLNTGHQTRYTIYF